MGVFTCMLCQQKSSNVSSPYKESGCGLGGVCNWQQKTLITCGPVQYALLMVLVFEYV
jgi:hypothetical protein